jgi:hypothetical protein
LDRLLKLGYWTGGHLDARFVQSACFVFVQSIQFINALPDNCPLMTTYDLATEYWGDQSVITIVAEDGASIGFLPLSFVQSGGVNTWRYVLDVVHNLVASNIRGFIQSSGGISVALDSEPQAGIYTFRPNGERSDRRAEQARCSRHMC